MKRIDLVRHLEAHGCRLLREGGSHSVYVHAQMRKVSAVPRHREIKRVSREEDLQGFGDPAALISHQTRLHVGKANRHAHAALLEGRVTTVKAKKPRLRDRS